MVRYNNMSVLRRLDLDNLKSLQRVMTILAINLQQASTEFEESKEKTEKLTLLESQWVKSIFRAIERNSDHPLLTRAIIRLCVARNESEFSFSTAIRELEDLANEDVLMLPESHMEAYTVALARFNAMTPSKNQRLLEEAYV